MEAIFTINGVDFRPWCKENGVQQTDIVRRSRSVTTMDGTLHLHQTLKRGISVSLLEVRHETLMTIAQALTIPTRPWEPGRAWCFMCPARRPRRRSSRAATPIGAA